MRPIKEMTKDEVNAAIAKLRGEEMATTVHVEWPEGLQALFARLGAWPPPIYGPGAPDYFEWEWGGVLLEELVRGCHSIAVTVTDGGNLDLTGMAIGDIVRGRELRDIVPYAWLIWAGKQG